MKANLARVLYNRVAELKDLKERRDRGEAVFTHIPTGLKAFDTRFGGLEIGILTLLIGHTGDGKTAFLGHLAKAAASAGLGVLLVLLEDPAGKLADRYLAGVMGESANKLARLQFDDPARLDAAAASEAEWAKHVALVSGEYSAQELLQVVDETEAVGGAPLKLVIVDYAQSFSEEEGTLEKVCAQLAKGLNVRAGRRGFASVLGSQARTQVMDRGRARWERTLAQGRPDPGGYRPGKGDAMWSQRLMQYSKAVWTIFREGRWRRELGDPTAKDNRIEGNVVKANFGPEGSEVFEWDGKSCTISDLS